MTNEERNTALYQKMFAEQEKSRPPAKPVACTGPIRA